MLQFFCFRFDFLLIIVPIYDHLYLIGFNSSVLDSADLERCLEVPATWPRFNSSVLDSPQAA
jgi:hypothetical protein